MVEIEAKQVYTVECPSPGCPTPERVVRDGWKNKQQRYECKGCGNHFFAEGKALYKQFPANQIAAAVDMYYSGMSLKQVAEHLEDTRDIPEPSKATVQAWVRAYTQLAKQVMDGKVGLDGTGRTATGKRVLADVGDHWVADEMMVRVGGEKLWNWNVMDAKTRYILATRISRTRNTNDAIEVFEQALANAEAPPKKITTDGLASYVDAARAVFPKGTEHEVADGIYELVNNNRSERLQGSFRQRIKTQRGHQTRATAQEYLDGWAIDYNFFKDHHALGGRTPAQVAGVAEQVPWTEWEDITRLGGEVAEARLLEHTAKRKKPGPKPQITGVMEAVQALNDAKEVGKAHARRQAKRSPSVAAVPKGRSARRKGGRGKAGAGK